MTVLAVLADTLERNVKKLRATKRGLKFVNFVKEGETGPRAGVEGNGLLGTATDWKMRVDLKQRMELKFPSEIAVTNKRLDIVIWLAKTKQAVLLELTVPWEERIEEAYERKNLKYQELVKKMVNKMYGRSGSLLWKWDAEVLLDSQCGEH
ncbi:uncharacterized protein LOC144619291 [Crassostrea virginica]